MKTLFEKMRSNRDHAERMAYKRSERDWFLVECDKLVEDLKEPVWKTLAKRLGLWQDTRA